MAHLKLIVLFTIGSLAIGFLIYGSSSIADKKAQIDGELKRWHKITLSLRGPDSSETATPNPFLDYRMLVTFKHPKTGLTYKVPGYFAADGNAAHTSAVSGDIWRAHLSPDEIGQWDYKISFHTGPNIAIHDDLSSGEEVIPYHGIDGTFEISETDKSGRDHRAKGRLQYVNKHHLRFAGNNEYFLKAGADAPENLLAYEDFDDTPDTLTNNKKYRKSWTAHQKDYVEAEALNYTWADGKGTELLGAIHYLASEGLNVFSFLTFNIDGDDDNVFPHLLRKTVQDYENIEDNKRWENTTDGIHHDRFDVSKLDQWEQIFSYADKKGMYLHFKTQETENDELMDNGELVVIRKLYYRELIARFSHHLALNWNLGEENDIWKKDKDLQQTRVKGYAQYFYETDPYHHHLVLHTYPNQKNKIYPALVGDASKFTGASLQTNKPNFSMVFRDVKKWVNQSAASGKPWVVACDEPGDAKLALRPDADKAHSHTDGRKNALWGTIMAGGAGVEFYFGYQAAHSDLSCQDFRSRDRFWDYCRYLLTFFKDNQIPFQDMRNQDSLSSNAKSWCLAKPDDNYVIYLKEGGTTSLDLSGCQGTYDVKWFDPRNGGSLLEGSVPSIEGGDKRLLGNPPDSLDQDWAILIRKAPNS
ncbi:MAG: DUF5060 domain-containing protein [Verrucomicrobiota bacterium]